MVATFVVEDGTGKSDANSYADRAFADQYHENYLASTDTTWSAKTDAEKELALRLGTQAVEQWFRDRWRGAKANKDQALAWPRVLVIVDGFNVSATTIPEELKQAVSVLALRSLAETLVPDIATPGDIKRKKVRAGPVEQDITYVGGSQQTKEYSLIEGMLRNLIHLGTPFERS